MGPHLLRTIPLCTILIACVGGTSSPPDADSLPEDLSARGRLEGLGELPSDPQGDPSSAEKVRLGRRLFFDPDLSADGTLSCASCHDPRHGFASPDPIAVGIRKRKGRRNAPSLLNVAYGTSMFWDGRVATLEEQALLPLVNPREMGNDEKSILSYLREDDSYPRWFEEAFGKGDIRMSHVARALASFERALLIGDSPVDRFRASKTRDLGTRAKLGLWLFESRARCWQCHAGPNFSDGRFHNTGVGWKGKEGDQGRFEVTGKESDRGAFKTPGLRALTRTAPYMHDGSMKTLEEVVRYYSRGGNANPHLSPKMKPLQLTEEEVRNLVAFLEALTGRHAWEMPE